MWQDVRREIQRWPGWVQVGLVGVLVWTTLAGAVLLVLVIGGAR